MEDKIVCPNCLGYGCHVVYADMIKLKVCAAYNGAKSCEHMDRSNTFCCCQLCGGDGIVSWIDLLFSNNYNNDNFNRLRDNIEEIKKLIEGKEEWKIRLYVPTV